MDKSDEIQTVRTSGEHDEFVHIGRDKFLRSELLGAFGGDFRPGLTLPPSRKLGNPTPMGLAGFSIGTLFLCMLIIGTRSITNLLIANALSVGSGLVMILAAMWEIAVENTYGAVTIGSYGFFWLSYMILNTPAFGVAKAYSEEDLTQATGMYLWCWTILSFIVLLPTIRSTWPFFSMIFFVFLMFLLLSCSYTTGNDNVKLAGGWVGIIAAIFGFYNLMAGLLNYENSYIDIPPIFMPTAEKPVRKHHSD